MVPVSGPRRVTKRTSYTVEAVARALDLLRAFSEPPHEFGLSELARELGMTKNLAFRLLKTLELKGFVHRIGDRYVVGIAVAELGRFAIHRFDAIRSAAEPIMRELRTRSGETVYIAAREELGAVCIGIDESDDTVRGVLELGAQLPLAAGGAAKVLLAYMPPADIEAVIGRGLPAYTKDTITDPVALNRRLAQIRKSGYEFASEEYREWASAVAAPVFDGRGAVMTAIGVVGPNQRIKLKRTELIDLVVAAGAHLSAALRRPSAGQGTSAKAARLRIASQRRSRPT